MSKGIILLIQSPPDPGIGLLQIKQHFFFLFSFLYFIPFFNNFLSYKVFFWWIHLTIGLLVNCPFSIHEWILVLSSLNIKKKMYINFLGTSFHLSFFFRQKSMSRFFYSSFSLQGPDNFFYIVLVHTALWTIVQNSFFFLCILLSSYNTLCCTNISSWMYHTFHDWCFRYRLHTVLQI